MSEIRKFFCPETDEGVEKLSHEKSEEIGSRQGALRTIFSALLGISCLPIFGSLRGNRLFQQPRVFVGTNKCNFRERGIKDIRAVPREGF